MLYPGMEKSGVLMVVYFNGSNKATGLKVSPAFL
jgi:hypothetical protein